MVGAVFVYLAIALSIALSILWLPTSAGTVLFVSNAIRPVASQLAVPSVHLGGRSIPSLSDHKGLHGFRLIASQDPLELDSSSPRASRPIAGPRSSMYMIGGFLGLLVSGLSLLSLVSVVCPAIAFQNAAHQAPQTAELSVSGPHTASHAPRVIAVGDVHGDLYINLATLYSAGVIDDEGHWRLGDATLVQIGDILDRGDDCRYLLDFYDGLGKEAAVVGGQVIQLLGNHEVMNLEGQLAYVTPGDYNLFGGPGNRSAAFGKGGEYGTRLRAHPVVAVVNDTVFVHAGLLPSFAEKGVLGLNRSAEAAIAEQNWGASVFDDDGPVWTRDLIYAGWGGECQQVESSLTRLSNTEGRPLRRMVVGHTPMADGNIHSFCNGTLIDVDIAMSRGMSRYGHIGALSLVPDTSGPSRLTALPPPNQPYNPDVIAQLERRITQELRAKYLADGRYLPFA